jgi:polyisoprenoid-binding protein YceI
MKFQIAAIVIFSMLFSGPTLFAQQTQTQPQQNVQTATSPVPVQSVVFLAPSNSRISFVGIHVGDDPKPRLGGFSRFQGYAVVDPDNNAVTSISIDINVDSVWTQFEKLTGHLKNADFFDTAKFPAARFVSTEIGITQKGQCTITGNLTLHGATKSISFPANYRFENGGMLLAAKFQLDRSQFGMDQMLSGVDKLVEVEIFVGQQTSASKAEPGHGGDSKKKQSSVEPASELRQVSINLPNMT